MKQYLELLNDVVTNGLTKGDRTGTGTKAVFARQYRHNLADGFPLLKRNFIDLAINRHLNFGGFETSGQHYFEIDRKKYKLSAIREKIKNHFNIIEEFSPVLNKYHIFFILERKP